MDIKIGAQTFGPDATEEKKAKEAKSYVVSKAIYANNHFAYIVFTGDQDTIWVQRPWHHFKLKPGAQSTDESIWQISERKEPGCYS